MQRRESSREAVANALAELDRLTKELRSARDFHRSDWEDSDEGRPERQETHTPSRSPGLPALYLEERIENANRLAAQLGDELTRAGSRSGAVHRNLDSIHQELDRAARELQFLVSEVGLGFEPAPPVGASRPEWDESLDDPLEALPRGAAASAIPSGPSGFPAASYHDFTADRYDRTIRQLKSRRRRLFGWTLGFAIGISASLEILNVLAREPIPVIWLAVLPVVWLIPVPFFVLSFRGTQRILERNHLETGVNG